MTRLERDPVTGLFFRPNTEDLMILHEVLVQKTYGLTPTRPTDVVLDIGGNVGAAAIFFKSRVAHVVSYEPDADNRYVFASNMNESNAFNVKLIPAAVTSLTGSTRFFTNPLKNKACHSTVKKAGYDETTVPCESFLEIIERERPTVIKCDIEGGEFDLRWSELPDFVHSVAVEIHMNRRLWRLEHGPLLMSTLTAIGFRQVTGITLSKTSSWPKRTIWTRETKKV